jgi:hypothetical protein
MLKKDICFMCIKKRREETSKTVYIHSDYRLSEEKELEILNKSWEKGSVWCWIAVKSVSTNDLPPVNCVYILEHLI